MTSACKTYIKYICPTWQVFVRHTSNTYALPDKCLQDIHQIHMPYLTSACKTYIKYICPTWQVLARHTSNTYTLPDKCLQYIHQTNLPYLTSVCKCLQDIHQTHLPYLTSVCKTYIKHICPTWPDKTYIRNIYPTWPVYTITHPDTSVVCRYPCGALMEIGVMYIVQESVLHNNY